MDNDTASFAVDTLRCWWRVVGSLRYPGATRLVITADDGGGNGSRVRPWKLELQRLADEVGLTLEVHHLPPGTSKWNAIEHKLFSFISMNWRAMPLVSCRVIVDLIGATTTTTGLKVDCELDPTGVRLPSGARPPAAQHRRPGSADERLAIHRDDFPGAWNYAIARRSQISAVICG